MILINTDWPQLKSMNKSKREVLMLSMPSNLETHSTTDTSFFWKTPEFNYLSKDIKILFFYSIPSVVGSRMTMYHSIPEWNNIKPYSMTEHSTQSTLFLPSGHHQCTMPVPPKFYGTLHQELTAVLPTSLPEETQLVLSTPKMPTKIATMSGTDKNF